VIRAKPHEAEVISEKREARMLSARALRTKRHLVRASPPPWAKRLIPTVGLAA